MGEKMVMPNLCAVFQYSGTFVTSHINRMPSLLPQMMKAYVATETARLNHKKDKIRIIAESRRPVYIWGIGREFLYLYEAACLKQCNLADIIDMNPFKQKTASICGKKVSIPNVLCIADSDALLLITAIAHEETIRRSALGAGYPGEIANIA